MSTIRVKQIEHNRSKSARPNRLSVRSRYEVRGGAEVCRFALGGGTCE
jgi:hypothetical protein